MVREALESNEGQMEAAVEALLAFGEARARVSGGAARFPGSSGPSGAGAGGRDQILSDELLAMQLQEELLREGELPRPPDLSEALGGLWGSVSAAATDLGNLAVTTGRAVAEGVSSVAVNLLSEEGGGGGGDRCWRWSRRWRRLEQWCGEG